MSDGILIHPDGDGIATASDGIWTTHPDCEPPCCDDTVDPPPEDCCGYDETTVPYDCDGTPISTPERRFLQFGRFRNVRFRYTGSLTIGSFNSRGRGTDFINPSAAACNCPPGYGQFVEGSWYQWAVDPVLMPRNTANCDEPMPVTVRKRSRSGFLIDVNYFGNAGGGNCNQPSQGNEYVEFPDGPPVLTEDEISIPVGTPYNRGVGGLFTLVRSDGNQVSFAAGDPVCPESYGNDPDNLPAAGSGGVIIDIEDPLRLVSPIAPDGIDDFRDANGIGVVIVRGGRQVIWSYEPAYTELGFSCTRRLSVIQDSEVRYVYSDCDTGPGFAPRLTGFFSGVSTGYEAQDTWALEHLFIVDCEDTPSGVAAFF